jgi:LacI family gluconate utilization system Gnt-I transcriptional repressor
MGFVRDKLSKSLTQDFRTMKKKRPVLQDVADRVGVTKMTVSRFFT